MPRTFTLDTRCLIAVANNEPASGTVQERLGMRAPRAGPTLLWLRCLHLKNDEADITSGISENHTTTWFHSGLGHLNVILPIGYSATAFRGRSWPDDPQRRSLSTRFTRSFFRLCNFCHRQILQLTHGAIGNVTFRPSMEPYSSQTGRVRHSQLRFSQGRQESSADRFTGAGLIEHPGGALSLPLVS